MTQTLEQKTDCFSILCIKELKGLLKATLNNPFIAPELGAG